jgi:hypothetical protein
VSGGKRGGRFSYLTSAEESTQATPLTTAEESGQETNSDSLAGTEKALSKTHASDGGEGGSGRTSRAEALTSVPKGQGRMKQERSQLNVRLPTTLKRQASAKAVLEGRDIGEVVEELLREYLDR